MDLDRDSRSIANMQLRRETLLPDVRLAFCVHSINTGGSSNVDCLGERCEGKTYRYAFGVLDVDDGAVSDQPLGGFDVFDTIERRISVPVGYIHVPT